MSERTENPAMQHARRRSERARLQLVDTMSEIQGRLNPRVLMREAWDEVRDHGIEVAGQAVKAVKARPGLLAAVAGAAALVIARQPILRTAAGMFSRDEETGGHDAGLTDDDPVATIEETRA